MIVSISTKKKNLLNIILNPNLTVILGIEFFQLKKMYLICFHFNTRMIELIKIWWWQIMYSRSGM